MSTVTSQERRLGELNIAHWEGIRQQLSLTIQQYVQNNFTGPVVHVFHNHDQSHSISFHTISSLKFYLDTRS